MRRSFPALCLGIAVLFTSTLALGGSWDEPLTPAFHQAAADYDVPVELLLVVGKLGSAFENRGAEPTIEEGYGVMALRANALGGQSLEDASLLTGVDVETLKMDPVANIRGAAAVLDAYAQEEGIDRSIGLDAWQNVILRYAGLDLESSYIFEWEVYDRLADGFTTTNSLGETFTLTPQLLGFDPEDLAPPPVMTVQPLDGGQVLSTDYGPAVWDPAASCNYSTTYISHENIIIHTIEGSYAGCISWFKNCNSSTSSHYVVAEDGRVAQCVREMYKAWHVGCLNGSSIGIEHEGYAASSSHPQSLYNASGDLCKDICNAYGIPKAHHACPPGILGHKDANVCVCGGTHWDPGNGWDWTYFINRVNGTPSVPNWAADFKAQSFPSSMTAGTTAVVWVEFYNRGTQTWYHCQTKLGTSSPQDRTSPFCTPNNWACADGSNPGCHRPTDVDQSSVTTNQVGRFTFIMTAPATPGTYTEKFKLVREGVTWFGPEVSATITVNAALGNLTGTVRNASNGAAIPGASVACSGAGSTTTNSSGVYNFSNVTAGSHTVSVTAAGFTPASSSVTITAGATATKDFNLTVADTEPPTTPTSLVVTGTTSSSVSLSWTASTDNTGVTGYDINVNGSTTDSSTTNSYTDSGLSAQTTYTYKVRAKDAAGNTSGWSNTVVAYTKTVQVTVFSDGFNGNFNNWTGVTGFSYSTGQNHGSLTGAGAAYAPAASATAMYHSLGRPFAQGKVSGYYYDDKGGWKPTVCGTSYRQCISLRDFDGAAKMYIDNEFYNTPDNSKYYYRLIWTGGPNAHTIYATRDPNTDCNGTWVYFETTVTPTASAASTVLKVTDRAGTTTSTQNLGGDYFSYGIGRVTLGLGIVPNSAGYWDDISFAATAPNIPGASTPTALSTTQIQWAWTPADNNAFAFEVYDDADAIKSPAWPAAGWIDHNTTTWTEGGLTANTSYTRKFKAWNGTLGSLFSPAITATTLSVAPVAGSITASPASACLGTEITWTAVNGFGPGQVAGYRYAFDQNATYTFTGTEPIWTGGTLVIEPAEAGTWYLHVQGCNADGVPNGTYDYAVVATEPLTPEIGSNSPVCLSGTINLTAPTVAGATYSWTGPNSFTSTEQNPSITGATSAEAGTYSMVMTSGGCTSPAVITDVSIVECGPPVQISAWRSAHTHGGADVRKLSLAADTTATVEPRAGGLQSIEIEFNQDVSVHAGISVIGYTTVDGILQDAVDYSSQATAIAAGNVVTVTFTGALPDATCYTIDLDGAIQNSLGAFLNRAITDTDCRVRALVGDVDGSSDVSAADVSAIMDKAATRAPSADNMLYDLNCGGGDIVLGDALLARIKVGNQALCP